MLIPKEVLYRALGFDPGKGMRISFSDKAGRERFRWRLYSAMSAEVRASKKDLPANDPEWGTHPWMDVAIHCQGERSLWLGTEVDNEVQVEEDVPREEEKE